MAPPSLLNNNPSDEARHGSIRHLALLVVLAPFDVIVVAVVVAAVAIVAVVGSGAIVVVAVASPSWRRKWAPSRPLLHVSKH